MTATRVSIVIKTLNEERNIAVAVESALQAVQQVGGEVIVADSGSTDRTVEIASRHGVTVVQLAHPHERCCGIGPQLGYQHSAGEFVYILDGDMRMLDGFLPAAVEYMRTHPAVVGVGGLVVELNTSSLEYIARTEKAAGHMAQGEVDRLDMGGLYRRSAVERAGYFSDRNLHSYEELDLAIRLRVDGGILWRLNIPAVEHSGHDAPPYALLRKRWRSRYIRGSGELLRANASRTKAPLLAAAARELRLYAAVWVWWLLMIALLVHAWEYPVAGGLALLVLALPFVAMGWRKRSMSKACFSVVSWNFNALGAFFGLLAPRTPPTRRIDSVVIHHGSGAPAGKSI